MSIILCPGIHSVELTHQFLAELSPRLDQALVFPAERQPVYSGHHILEFLEPALPGEAVLFIAFSAGVVGAIAAARSWNRTGGQVKAVIAIDGWGVPLFGDFPIHRMSHDAFTHWSSAWLGAGQDSFYADPPVEHLEMWRSPQTIKGYCTGTLKNRRCLSENDCARTTASLFLLTLLRQYEVKTV